MNIESHLRDWSFILDQFNNVYMYMPYLSIDFFSLSFFPVLFWLMDFLFLWNMIFVLSQLLFSLFAAHFPSYTLI